MNNFEILFNLIIIYWTILFISITIIVKDIIFNFFNWAEINDFILIGTGIISYIIRSLLIILREGLEDQKLHIGKDISDNIKFKFFFKDNSISSDNYSNSDPSNSGPSNSNPSGSSSSDNKAGQVNYDLDLNLLTVDELYTAKFEIKDKLSQLKDENSSDYKELINKLDEIEKVLDIKEIEEFEDEDYYSDSNSVESTRDIKDLSNQELEDEINKCEDMIQEYTISNVRGGKTQIPIWEERKQACFEELDNRNTKTENPEEINKDVKGKGKEKE